MENKLSQPGCMDSEKTLARTYSDGIVGFALLTAEFALFMLLFTLFSCSSVPAENYRSASRAVVTGGAHSVANLESGDSNESPKPGDTKIMDGIEYIYASNRRYLYTPSEPEYVWIRKDQYSPRIGENLLSRKTEKKEMEELEKRISKLEEQLKKRNTPPQIP